MIGSTVTRVSIFSTTCSRKIQAIGPALALVALLLGPPNNASAQVLYGSIVGNVSDASGAMVPHATVSAIETQTGATHDAVTNGSGGYSFSNLPQGTYQVTVTTPGFGTVIVENVVVSNNGVRRVDAKINPANVQEAVTVSAESVGLQADRADVNTQITAQQIADLPTSANRNFQSLVRTVPGATPPSGSHSTAANPQQTLTYFINGAPNTSNTVNIDGASDFFPWFPENAAYTPPQEAIASVNLVTNSFDAEIGFGAGSAMNVTIKSGTNKLHGAAWGYNTLSNLAARNYFTPTTASKPKNIVNQFGGNIGGPIIKDKLFFFFNYERFSQRTAQSGIYTIPTASLIAGDFSGVTTTIYDPTTGDSTGANRTPFPGNKIPSARISGAAQKMLALLPAPNLPGNVSSQGTISSNFYSSSVFALTRVNYDAKVNYAPGGKKYTLFSSYSGSPSSVFDGQIFGAAGGPTNDGGVPGGGPGLAQRVTIGGTYAFTNHFLLDSNIGFTRLNVKAVNVDIGTPFGTATLNIPGTNSGARAGNPLDNGIPNFQLSGFTSLGNTNASSPFQFRSNSWVEAANFTWLHGTHNVRFGGQVFHFLMANFQANSQYGIRGGFSFTGGLTTLKGGSTSNQYNGLADFLLGLPYQMGEDHQVVDPAVLKENEFGFYARDSWQVTPSLTATYGVRYELMPYSSSSQFGGLVYNPATNQIILGGRNGAPQNAGVDVGHGWLVPRVGLAYRLGSKTVIRSGFSMNPNAQIFRNNTQNYPLVASAQYSGANTYSAGGDLRTGIPTFTPPDLSSSLTLLPNLGTGTYPLKYRRGYSINTNLFVERDLGAGFLYNVGYVHSHGFRMDTAWNINAGQPGGGKASQPLYQAFGNASTINLYIPMSSYDYNALQTTLKRQVGVRGSITVSYTYSKTLDSTDSGDESGLAINAVGYLYRNYALAGFDRTHSFQVSGSYASPFGKGQRWLTHGLGSALAGGWQLNSVLLRTSGTPFSVTASGTSLNAPGNTQYANRVGTRATILGGHGVGNPYFDPNAYVPVTTATFGNSSRNELRGPGYFDVDASLFRDFPIHEMVKFQFRAEAFALTNTPNFGNPGSNVSSTSSYTYITGASGSRQVRFGAKLSF